MVANRRRARAAAQFGPKRSEEGALLSLRFSFLYSVPVFGRINIDLYSFV
jgi:hypothetical protein